MERITFAPALLQGRVRIPIGGDSPRAERQEPLELRHRQCSLGMRRFIEEQLL